MIGTCDPPNTHGIRHIVMIINTTRMTRTEGDGNDEEGGGWAVVSIPQKGMYFFNAIHHDFY